MLNLPGYIATNNLTSKYTRNTTPFKFGRVDGGYMTNCFVYCCRDFITLNQGTYFGGVGGSIRATNCAADICNNFLLIEQTQRGFGIAAVNCWASTNVVTTCDPVTGQLVSRLPSVVRFAGTTSNLENAHVELIGFKRIAGRAVSGIPDTGTPQQAFFFDNPTAPYLSITCSSCDFDESNAPIDATFGLVSGLSSFSNRIVSFAACHMRSNQTDPQMALNAVLRSNYNGTDTPAYAFDQQSGYTGGPGPVTNFRRFGTDSGYSEIFGLDAVYKNSSNSNKAMAAWRTQSNQTVRQDLLTVDYATGNVELPLSTWNTNALRLGNYTLWVSGTGVLRIKNGLPTSDTDGVSIGSQT